MADINGRREPARSEIDVDAALAMRSRMTWDAIGRELAAQKGRPAPFQGKSVIVAIKAAGREAEVIS